MGESLGERRRLDPPQARHVCEQDQAGDTGCYSNDQGHREFSFPACRDTNGPLLIGLMVICCGWPVQRGGVPPRCTPSNRTLRHDPGATWPPLDRTVAGEDDVVPSRPPPTLGTPTGRWMLRRGPGPRRSGEARRPRSHARSTKAVNAGSPAAVSALTKSTGRGSSGTRPRRSCRSSTPRSPRRRRSSGA